MSTQYRLVQSGKTASGGCSAGQGSSEPVAPRIYFINKINIQPNVTHEVNSKSKFQYFIPVERIPALSWQACIQLVHILTTSGETKIVDQRTQEFFFYTTMMDLTVLPQP
jgi:hypothetical protein